MIKRWDIYDIADELADVPCIIRQGIDDPRVLSEAMHDLEDLISRLWVAARVGGWVMPAHQDYQPWDGPGLTRSTTSEV